MQAGAIAASGDTSAGGSEAGGVQAGAIAESGDTSAGAVAALLTTMVMSSLLNFSVGLGAVRLLIIVI